MFIANEQLNKLNLGIIEEPRIMLVSITLPKQFQLKVKQLLTELKDVFAWNYMELKRIPKPICEHKIELIADARPIKQHAYQMNLNYAQRVREDLDKLLDAQFIFPIEAT
jgi:hypothetical protein